MRGFMIHLVIMDSFFVLSFIFSYFFQQFIFSVCLIVLFPLIWFKYSNALFYPFKQQYLIINTTS